MLGRRGALGGREDWEPLERRESQEPGGSMVGEGELADQGKLELRVQ